MEINYKGKMFDVLNAGNTDINAEGISKKRQKGSDRTSLSLDILKSLLFRNPFGELNIGYSDKIGLHDLGVSFSFCFTGILAEFIWSVWKFF